MRVLIALLGTLMLCNIPLLSQTTLQLTAPLPLQPPQTYRTTTPKTKLHSPFLRKRSPSP